MASCREFVELWLDDHLDGQLPPRRRAESARHLAGCASCREYLRSYRLLRRALRQSRDSDTALPDPLVQQILRAAS